MRPSRRGQNLTATQFLFLTFDRLLPPLAGTAILALIGAIAIWTHHGWLVPSLGSAALIQTMTPYQSAAKPWSTVVGQLVAVGGGIAGVYAVGAQSAPPLMSGHPFVWSRIGAVGIAVIITAVLQQLLRAKNPAGGAAALLMAIGTISPDLHGAVIMVVGILLVSALGETARFAILRTHSAARARRGTYISPLRGP